MLLAAPWIAQDEPTKESIMGKHSHEFVENYKGEIAFGLSRELDEASFKVFLQKFSDDRLLELICPRLTQEEMDRTIHLLTGLMRAHLEEKEYHELFLR